MDGQNGRGAGADRRRDGLGIDQSAAARDVDADRAGAGMLHRQRARDERVGRDDHLVAGPDARRLQHDRQRRRARRDADALAHTTVGGKVGLELLDLFAQDEPARGQHAVEDCVQLFGQGFVLPSKVGKWHREHCGPTSRWTVRCYSRSPDRSAGRER